MRFSLGLPTDRVWAVDEFVTGEAVAEVAAAAERAGFDACFVTDHPFPGNRWLAAGGHHSLDPFVALSFAAAATERLLLQTNMYVAAYRNPFSGAKAIASLDVLSGGRLIVGVAAGYLEPEFEALGASFENRNDATDEAIRAMRLAWTGEPVETEGSTYRVPGNTMLPTPVAPSGPPIWIGGNSRRAMRRAVELADGWVPFPTPRGVSTALRTAPIETPADLADRLDLLRSMADAAGRVEPLDVCFVPFGLNMIERWAWSAQRLAEEIDELDKLGVTWLTVTLPGTTRGELMEATARFGDEIVSS